MNSPEPRDFQHPYEPYPLQMDFMNALYDCIDRGDIGLFSSPTGTGKSLSLLCGSLTWLRDQAKETPMDENQSPVETAAPDWVRAFETKRLNEKKKEQEQEMKRLAEELLDTEKQMQKRRALETSLPSSSETDDQFLLEPYHEDSDAEGVALDRVRKEYESALHQKHKFQQDEQPDQLKILFCSRTHSQLTQLIEELRKTQYAVTSLSSAAIRVAPLASRKQLCINSTVLKHQNVQRINDECLDLQKKSACPYLPATANDGSDRRLWEFRDKVIQKVQDIEDLARLGRERRTCPYYGVRNAIPPAQLVTLPYSMLLSPATRKSLGISLKNNIVIVDEAHNLVDAINQLNSIKLAAMDLENVRNQLQLYLKKYYKRLLGLNIVYIKQLLFILSRVQGDLLKRFQARSDTKHVDAILTIADYVHELKIDHINLFKIDQYLEKSQLAKKLNGFVEHQAASAVESTGREQKHTTLMYQIKAFLMMLNNPDADGRILIHAEAKPNEKTSMNSGTSSVQFLLLNPSNYFTDIVEEARSIILAGGTMDPVSDFIQQLFPKVAAERITHFSCGHIVPKENIEVLIVGKGPTGMEFEFTFQTRQQSDLLNELGLAILNYSCVIPDGIVVFFASYQYMDFVLKLWKAPHKGQSPIWERLQAHKRLFIEPKEASQLDECFESYTNTILHPDQNETQTKSKKVSGAILFCVVGGKMSEGINFSNQLGRAVVMVGLPFPNLHSPELKEKMEYMDLSSSRKTDNPIEPVSGKEYYDNLCMRAVNQSIGRAIRHRNDYACVILLDKRYSQSRIKRKLPGWMSPSIVDLVQSQSNFGDSIVCISRFFKNR